MQKNLNEEHIPDVEENETNSYASESSSDSAYFLDEIPNDQKDDLGYNNPVEFDEE